jgi:putative sterol carrier protein
MKKIISIFIALFALNASADLKGLVDGINNSTTPAELVASGWAANDGGKGYKILQIIVKGTDMSAELQLDKTGKIVASKMGATSKLDTSVDYKMTATAADWKAMGTGERGPMYHMSPLGGLSFDGPMVEAMKNMGPFANFLIQIGTNL